MEKIAKVLMIAFSALSVLATFAIAVLLITETLTFFRFEGITINQFLGTKLDYQSPTNPLFGVMPMVVGTVLSSVIAILVAGPIGLGAAIYLSEFASRRVRNILKPCMELLSGIPSIVYGFFAFSVVTPVFSLIIPGLQYKNILSPGIAMGIMILPLVASMSEDALAAVPRTLRDGAYGLGATPVECTFQVVVPSAFSGIVASFVLAISRAIGETMIIVLASGATNKALSFDVRNPMLTMSSYIVEVLGGDGAAKGEKYYSLFAVGLLLFLFTLAMNAVAKKISRTFRERY